MIFLVLLSLVSLCVSQRQGSTSYYWDCCKPSCASKSTSGVTSPVMSCSADMKQTFVDKWSSSTDSGCSPNVNPGVVGFCVLIRFSPFLFRSLASLFFFFFFFHFFSSLFLGLPLSVVICCCSACCGGSFFSFLGHFILIFFFF